MMKTTRKLLPVWVFLLLSLLTADLPRPASAEEYNRETPVVKAVRIVSPAVVSISSAYQPRRSANPFSGFGMNPLFDSFFKDFFEPRLQQRPRRTHLGSGVIIDGKRGLILTNAHVVEKTGTITVTLKDDREFEARIVGVDTDSDLAVLRIESPGKLPSVHMGSSEDLMIGETVIAIGNPFGFSHTVTTGVVSALNRSIRAEDRVYHDFIQIDASINPGNSGGPLLNINGELIGINTAIYARAQGIGFAIPISKAKKIISDLIRYGQVIPAWIGVTVQDLDKRMAQYLNLTDSEGVLVKEVDRDSPAAGAGIREGDVLLSIADKPVSSSEDYKLLMRGIAAGDRIKAAIRQNHQRRLITITSAVFPVARAADFAWRHLGIRVKGRASAGVEIAEIRPASELSHIGVNAGDVIRQINDRTLDSVSDFQKAIVTYRQESSLVLLVQRGNQGYYITVRM